jgi:hypothetical protein
LTFKTSGVSSLANRNSEYDLTAETSGGARDFLVIALARRPDRSWLEGVFSASRGSYGMTGLLHAAGESWEWRFYVLEDRPDQHSRCRGRP